MFLSFLIVVLFSFFFFSMEVVMAKYVVVGEVTVWLWNYPSASKIRETIWEVEAEDARSACVAALPEHAALFEAVKPAQRTYFWPKKFGTRERQLFCTLYIHTAEQWDEELKRRAQPRKTYRTWRDRHRSDCE